MAERIVGGLSKNVLFEKLGTCSNAWHSVRTVGVLALWPGLSADRYLPLIPVVDLSMSMSKKKCISLQQG